MTLQVFSESVSKAIKLLGDDEVSATVKFVSLKDKFFNTMNVHNYTHGIHAQKPFQMPFTSADDWRLKEMYVATLKNMQETSNALIAEFEILEYLKKWEESVKERERTFTKRARNRKMLSAETRLGLKITCK